MRYLNVLMLLAIGISCGSRPQSDTPQLPSTLAGMNLHALADDYRSRLFDSYLPFWEHGGIDTEYGGFICHLDSTGAPVDGEKNLWFQGRGLWVYCFLYEHFGRDKRYLDIARRTYEFMREKIYTGGGNWHEVVGRDGTVIEGQGRSVYGQLFTANGLAQYFKVSGDSAALELALETLHAALERYNRPDYAGVFLPGDLGSMTGIRTQGHSMVIIRLLSQLLRYHNDPGLDSLADRHVSLLTNRFYNPEFGIVNEYLDHDYNRIPSFADQMFTGHSIETGWMLMDEALRRGDRDLFDLAKDRLKRFLEMSWDYDYGGLASGDYFVHGGGGRVRGTDYSVKTMWLQCEAMLGCLLVLEYTGERWAAEWYGRVRDFTLRTVAAGGIGVWAQATDRRGNLIERGGYHPQRRGNFHQPRYLMIDLLRLESFIAGNGKLTPFPSSSN